MCCLQTSLAYLTCLASNLGFQMYLSSAYFFLFLSYFLLACCLSFVVLCLFLFIAKIKNDTFSYVVCTQKYNFHSSLSMVNTMPSNLDIAKAMLLVYMLIVSPTKMLV